MDTVIPPPNRRARRAAGRRVARTLRKQSVPANNPNTTVNVVCVSCQRVIHKYETRQSEHGCRHCLGKGMSPGFCSCDHDFTDTRLPQPEFDGPIPGSPFKVTPIESTEAFTRRLINELGDAPFASDDSDDSSSDSNCDDGESWPECPCGDNAKRFINDRRQACRIHH